MQKETQNMNIRIKDIAEMAKVSIGTVDRVLHNRGHVSEDKRERVEKVLKEINYQPNMVARFLASKKKYTLAAIVPYYTPGSYWELACAGINHAADELKKFNLNIQYFQFDQYDRNSFDKVVSKMIQEQFNGVIIPTLFAEHVINLSAKLDILQVPYIYIDSNIYDQNNLAYFGGNSFVSGEIAAKLMLTEIGNESDIFFAYIKFKHTETSVQMKTREQGFLDYLQKNNYKGQIHVLEIDPDNIAQSLPQLKQILLSKKGLIGGIVFNSRVYELINLLEKLDEDLKQNLRLVGHDAIDKNAEALKNGQISFLLSQRPDVQGYDAVKSLGNYLLFNQKPNKENYMPIDILLKENISFYKNYKM